MAIRYRDRPLKNGEKSHYYCTDCGQELHPDFAGKTIPREDIIAFMQGRLRPPEKKQINATLDNYD